MPHSIVCVVILLVAAATSVPGQPPSEAAPCRVIDLLPDFQAYRALWQEGMASYVSAVVVPRTRMSTALGFTPEKMNLCERLLPRLAAELRDHLGSTDHALRRAYFGAEANDRGIPPEAGYYVGLLIVQRLARKHELSHLARLAPDAVFPLLRGELQELAGKGS